jgi:very-short-patch-repair endonuclease
MGAGATDIVNETHSGHVRAVFCHDVPLARRQFRSATEELEPLPTMVALEWARAPSLAHELDEIRDALADAAHSLWPNWYSSAEARFASALSQVSARDAAASIGMKSRGASASWLKEAWGLAADGKRPALPSMGTTEQVRQLSLAIDPSRLIFCLSVDSETSTPARIRGLARAAEWLAHNSGAKVILLLPLGWSPSAELDHVTYGAVTLAPDEPEPMLDPWALRGVESPSSSKAPVSKLHPVVVVGPIHGKPHPLSEVEQEVDRHLAHDLELKGLFQWNQRLETFGKKHFIVDLVWHEGKLIVEFDGPEHHGHLAYVRDRDRDYRFLMSGYSTLRIPNAEVCANISSVLQKLRNVVSLRKAQPKERKSL